MPSPPNTSPGQYEYNLRSRKKSPVVKKSHEEEISHSYQSSQSESSDTDNPADKAQLSLSSDEAADETDAGMSWASDGKDIPVDISKDNHADKIRTSVSYESKLASATETKTTPMKESRPSVICQIFILLLLVIFVGVVKFTLHSSELPWLRIQALNQNNQSAKRPVAYRLGNLTMQLELIKDKYTTLDDRFWDVVAGSSWSHIQGDGTFRQPVVLLLVGQPKSNLEVVAKDVASLYSNVFTMRSDGTIHIDGGQQAMKSAEQAKLDMDNLMKEGFRNGRQVTLVTKFDKLPPCSIMLFHSYCDNEYAPHKDVVIIFTVEVESAASTEGIEELVQEHLGTLWAQCPEEIQPDKIMAMHSRVSNNIAFVK